MKTPFAGFILTLSLCHAVTANDPDPFRADCEDCVAMSVVPAGTYQMGKYINYGFGDMDGPMHEVQIAKPFAVATAEVTVSEFRRFIEETGYVSGGMCNVYNAEDSTSWYIDPAKNWENPGFPQEENHPVVCVSWDDTQAYIAWLNKKTGNAYRLPSEAEWEYVAKTGGLGAGEEQFITHSEGNIGQVECCGGAKSGPDTWQYTAPVRSFPADKYNLHDIRGNVWEWQADCYQMDYVGAPTDGSARTTCDDDNYRAVRGGSYGDAGPYLSPRFRLRGPRSEAYFTAGFRVAHSLNEKE